MNERMGARPWCAHTLDDHARMLLARDAARDAEQAAGMLAKAAAIYRELGMGSWAERAEAAARPVQARHKLL